MPAVKRNRAQASKTAVKPVAKTPPAPAKAAATKKRDAKANQKQNDDIKVRNLVMTNGVPVDHLVPDAVNHEVVCYGPKSEPLNKNLMFTDCGQNNNKFYIVQGLKYQNGYFLWTRWGRVGVDGLFAKTPAASLDQLAREFAKKVQSKKSKGYTEIEIEYEEAKEVKPTAKDKAKKKPESKSALPNEVQNLLNFIFDMKAIEKSVMKIGLNVKKLPLGKLSKKTILDGFSVLKQIETALSKKNNKDELSRLSSEFYRYIPHDFQFQHMSKFIIDSQEKLKDKLKLVESLSDIRIAAEINNEVEENNDSLNAIDARYKKMNCKINPLDPKNKNYKTLCETITSCKQAGKVSILDVFEIEREGEGKKFKGNLGNRKLLWHGSGFSNWGGILSQGLRIAPPEAPCSGYRFGKGIYFADAIAKSIPYTRSYDSGGVCLLALCDVALGNTNNLVHSSYNAMNLPKGKHSTFGMGSIEASKEVDVCGAKAQMGPFKPSSRKQTCGGYSEFIIYNVDQCVIKYLFRCKVN